MLSKCANPACSKQFMHLHEGKIFRLIPTPEVEAAFPDFTPSLYERFWLCDECCKRMSLVWGGAEAKLVPNPDGGGLKDAFAGKKHREQQNGRRRTSFETKTNISARPIRRKKDVEVTQETHPRDARKDRHPIAQD